MKVKLEVNGEERPIDITPSSSLAETLRDAIGLTGVKRGCDFGGCGMCTVLLGGRPVYSCMTPAWRAEGKSVLTVEGLMKHGELDLLQEAFIERSAPQCGYCTGAMLMVGKALLDSKAAPSEVEVRDAICGVLCRCTGYAPYIEAIMSASRKMSR